MTIEELTHNPDKMASMSDAELLEFWKPYFTVTRPELVERVAPRQKTQTRQEVVQTTPISPEKKRALELLASEGVDLSFLNTRKKK